LKLVSRQDGKKKASCKNKQAGSQECSKESKAASARRESKKGQEQEQEGSRKHTVLGPELCQTKATSRRSKQFGSWQFRTARFAASF
jgi:hypothetical protein